MLRRTWHALYGNAEPRTDIHVDSAWRTPQYTPQREDIWEEQTTWKPVYTNDLHDILGHGKIDWGTPEDSTQCKEMWEEQEAWNLKYTNDLHDFEYEIKAILGEERGAALGGQAHMLRVRLVGPGMQIPRAIRVSSS